MSSDEESPSEGRDLKFGDSFFVPHTAKMAYFKVRPIVAYSLDGPVRTVLNLKALLLA